MTPRASALFFFALCFSPVRVCFAADGEVAVSVTVRIDPASLEQGTRLAEQIEVAKVSRSAASAFPKVTPDYILRDRNDQSHNSGRTRTYIIEPRF